MSSERSAILLIDRGSREQAVQDELRTLVGQVKRLGGFDVGEFALLEVRGPTVEEGLEACARAGAEHVVAYPYFLHNGMKCRAALEKVYELSKRGSGPEITPVETPLGVDQMLIDIVLSRLRSMTQSRPSVREDDCQVLLMGHGSSYPEERADFELITKAIRERSRYAEVRPCFLELARPNIEEGIKECLEARPRLVLIVPYFLHNGAHLQRDIPDELGKISKTIDLSNVLMGERIGTDPVLAELVVKRIREQDETAHRHGHGPDLGSN